MIAMDRKPVKVVISKKIKQAYAETIEIRDHITANACISQPWQFRSFCFGKKMLMQNSFSCTYVGKMSI